MKDSKWKRVAQFFKSSPSLVNERSRLSVLKFQNQLNEQKLDVNTLSSQADLIVRNLNEIKKSQSKINFSKNSEQIDQRFSRQPSNQISLEGEKDNPNSIQELHNTSLINPLDKDLNDSYQDSIEENHKYDQKQTQDGHGSNQFYDLKLNYNNNNYNNDDKSNNVIKIEYQEKDNQIDNFNNDLDFNQDQEQAIDQEVTNTPLQQSRIQNYQSENQISPMKQEKHDQLDIQNESRSINVQQIYDQIVADKMQSMNMKRRLKEALEIKRDLQVKMKNIESEIKAISKKNIFQEPQPETKKKDKLKLYIEIAQNQQQMERAGQFILKMNLQQKRRQEHQLQLQLKKQEQIRKEKQEVEQKIIEENRILQEKRREAILERLEEAKVRNYENRQMDRMTNSVVKEISTIIAQRSPPPNIIHPKAAQSSQNAQIINESPYFRNKRQMNTEMKENQFIPTYRKSNINSDSFEEAQFQMKLRENQEFKLPQLAGNQKFIQQIEEQQSYIPSYETYDPEYEGEKSHSPKQKLHLKQKINSIQQKIRSISIKHNTNQKLLFNGIGGGDLNNISYTQEEMMNERVNTEFISNKKHFQDDIRISREQDDQFYLHNQSKTKQNDIVHPYSPHINVVLTSQRKQRRNKSAIQQIIPFGIGPSPGFNDVSQNIEKINYATPMQTKKSSRRQKSLEREQQIDIDYEKYKQELFRIRSQDKPLQKKEFQYEEREKVNTKADDSITENSSSVYIPAASTISGKSPQNHIMGKHNNFHLGRKMKSQKQNIHELYDVNILKMKDNDNLLTEFSQRQFDYLQELRKERKQRETESGNKRLVNEDWKKIQQNKNLDHKEKTDLLLLSAGRIEASAKIKEQSAFDLDMDEREKIDAMYADSIKAKLAILENI